jgi:DNA ligase-1
MNSDDVFYGIELIAKNSSSLIKQEILELNKEEDILKEVLRLTYDPFIRFNITYSGPISDGYDVFSTETFELLENLQVVRGDAAKALLKRHLETLTRKSQILLTKLINKDLRCGINVKTINKVFPGLIRTVDYMRCSTMKEVPLEKIDFSRGVYSQLKANGMFCRAVGNSQGFIRFFTRKGHEFPEGAFPEISAELTPSMDARFDGELLVFRKSNFGYSVMLDRKTGNGLLNKLRLGTPLPEDCVVMYVVWDLRCDGLDEPYKKRFERLATIHDAGRSKYVQLIATRLCYTPEEAVEMNKRLVAEGEEGTVLKYADGYWRDGTSRDQIKFKNPFEIDLLVVGYVAGTGKNKETFGSLLCTTEDGILNVAVSGFTDEERRQDWLYSIITVRADEIIKDKKTGEPTLLNPRFVERRLDKDCADSFEHVKSQYKHDF